MCRRTWTRPRTCLPRPSRMPTPTKVRCAVLRGLSHRICSGFTASEPTDSVRCASLIGAICGLGPHIVSSFVLQSGVCRRLQEVGGSRRRRGAADSFRWPSLPDAFFAWLAWLDGSHGLRAGGRRPGRAPWLQGDQASFRVLQLISTLCCVSACVQGIKVALPAEITTGRTFLQLYIEHILAMQDRGQQSTPVTLLCFSLRVFHSVRLSAAHVLLLGAWVHSSRQEQGLHHPSRHHDFGCDLHVNLHV